MLHVQEKVRPKVKPGQHLLRHQDPSQFECQECRKVFTQFNFLELHAAEKMVSQVVGQLNDHGMMRWMNNSQRRGNLETLMTLKTFMRYSKSERNRH